MESSHPSPGRKESAPGPLRAADGIRARGERGLQDIGRNAKERVDSCNMSAAHFTQARAGTPAGGCAGRATAEVVLHKTDGDGP